MFRDLRRFTSQQRRQAALFQNGGTPTFIISQDFSNTQPPFE
jgi:hypothetical protein